MKIRMKTTEQGSTDGIRSSTYEADKEYDLGATPGEIDLAAAFVAAGMASPIGQAQAPKIKPGKSGNK